MTTFDSRDGRFTIERHHRQPRRGTADRVVDGWELTDTITGVTIRTPTIADANRYTHNRITHEQTVVALNARRSWITTPTTGPAPIGIREAWGTTPTGQRFMLGAFPATPDIEQHITALCDHLGIRP